MKSYYLNAWSIPDYLDYDLYEIWFEDDKKAIEFTLDLKKIFDKIDGSNVGYILNRETNEIFDPSCDGHYFGNDKIKEE